MGRKSGSARRWFRCICARARSTEELLPWLYPKGISTGDFSEALCVLVGHAAQGLSSSTISREKMRWCEEHQAWSRRDLEDKRYVCIWADGVCFTPRMDSDRRCMLAVIGVDEHGEKDMLAIEDGFRGNADSWRDLLERLKSRGAGVLDGGAARCLP